MDVQDDQISVPRFIYGTAWKEEQTQPLVELALQAGFRGIDTANQRKHYHEAAVGEAIESAVQNGLITREELFLQTKYTFQRGQDHRLPYDPDAPIATQVEQSFESSLEHLGVNLIDSYLLHGPSRSEGLHEADWQAWRAMESLHESGRVRLLGISNVSISQLETLCEQSEVFPRMVQNRCYANRQWDLAVRSFCTENNILYQGFSLLTANRQFLSAPLLKEIASRHSRTPEQIVFRFALAAGMLPLTGTSTEVHMRQDLEVFDFELEPAEFQTIHNIALS